MIIINNTVFFTVKSTNQVEVQFGLLQKGMFVGSHRYAPKKDTYCMIPSIPHSCFIIKEARIAIDKNVNLFVQDYKNKNHWMILDQNSEFHVFEKKIIDKKIEYLTLLD